MWIVAESKRMDNTTNLNMPYIMAAQSQKHVTHNEALRALDIIVQLSVLGRNLTNPPASPADGDRYIIAASATGDWLGHEGKIAAFQDNAWVNYMPQEGWVCWVAGENKLLAWDGAAWDEVLGGGSSNPVPLVGVNSTADATNRLSVSAPNSLFTHEGSDHRIKINKAAVADTASFLFQNNWSGRAEVGLTGDDGFHFKVSADGSSWKDAIAIDEASGHVSFPHGSSAENHLINGDFAINQREFAGGALTDYGYDRWKADAGGVDLSVSGNTVSLNSGAIIQIIEAPELAGQTITLSVEALVGGNLSVDIEGQTGIITAGSGRRGIAIAVPAGSTGNIILKLSPVSSAVSFSRVKLETGPKATNWQPRHRQSELLLCYRYFQRHQSASYAETGGGHVVNSTIVRVRRQYFAPMRVAPTFSGGGSLSDFIAYLNGSLYPLSLNGIIGVTKLDTSLTFTGNGLAPHNVTAVRQQTLSSYFDFDSEI